MPRKINIIGKADGAGLSRDLALLADALRSADHEVSIVTIDDPQARLRCSLLRRWVTRVCSWRERPTGATQVDLNLMLEHAWPQYLRTARTNVVIPNPEWFDRHDQHLLPCLDGVWAKTQHAQELFTALRCNTTLIGFDGVDRHHPGVPRNRTFFHLAGGSRNRERSSCCESGPGIRTGRSSPSCNATPSRTSRRTTSCA